MSWFGRDIEKWVLGLAGKGGLMWDFWGAARWEPDSLFVEDEMDDLLVLLGKWYLIAMFR
jgi:hypothetical protein